MTEDAQILIARLLAHQTLRREDKLVKRALSDENFRTELDARLKACGMKFVDNVYADYVTLALTRDSESKVFGTKETWQNNNFGLARDGVALLVVLWSLIILPKRERQEAHQLAEEDQNDMFGKEKPLPRAEDTSIGISYRALLADFGDKLGKKNAHGYEPRPAGTRWLYRTQRRSDSGRPVAGSADGYRHTERPHHQWRAVGYFPDSCGAHACDSDSSQRRN